MLPCTGRHGLVPGQTLGGDDVGKIGRGDYCWNAKTNTCLVLDEVGEATYICAFVAVGVDGRRSMHTAILTAEGLTKIEYPQELRALADMLS